MAGSESNGRRRISVELPDSLIQRLDELKNEWGIKARGDCLTRLLEDIFSPDDGSDDEPECEFSPIPAATVPSDETGDSKTSDDKPSEREPRFNEERALVLIGNGRLSLDDEEDVEPTPPPKGTGIGVTKGGIDLPGFVRKRTTEIRDSLRTKPSDDLGVDAPLLPTVHEDVLVASARSVKDHWLNLYGKPAGETVLEAAMTWLGRDIWPSAEGHEGRTFTWSQTVRLMNGVCPGWIEESPRFEQVIVVAGVLEDPFATSELVHRIPTLIRRFVNRFKRSRKVTSFETLESTMTVHGALKLLKMPTTAGASLTLKMIREAYKQQALETHPDAGGSTEEMRRLNEAYQMLRELYRQKT